MTIITDYIKREDAINSVICLYTHWIEASDNQAKDKYYAEGKVIIDAINQIPPANVVERSKYENCRRTLFELSECKQGEWLKLGEDIGRRHYLTCSVCRRDIATYDIFHFCPNCGAMMTRGESNEID